MTHKHTHACVLSNTRAPSCTCTHKSVHIIHTHTNVSPPELSHNAVESILPTAAMHPFAVFSPSLPPPTRTLGLWSQLQHPLRKEPTQYLSVCACEFSFNMMPSSPPALLQIMEFQILQLNNIPFHPSMDIRVIVYLVYCRLWCKQPVKTIISKICLFPFFWVYTM